MYSRYLCHVCPGFGAGVAGPPRRLVSGKVTDTVLVTHPLYLLSSPPAVATLSNHMIYFNYCIYTDMK